MSVLKEYSSSLYSRLLDNYGVRRYWDQPVYIKEQNGEYVPVSWLSDYMIYCESLANYIADSQAIVLPNMSSLGRETKFFVSIAHIMFVPFGQAGYDYLKKVVSERFDGKEIGEFLYEQFTLRSECPLNGSLLQGLNDEQKDYIKDFFMNFDKKDEIICTNAKDIATLACRLYFALYGIVSSSCQIKSLNEKYMEPITSKIESQLGFKEEAYKFKISDYINQIPQHGALSPNEKKFILSKFSLN